MCKHAVIICGGKGSRLMPYTNSLPKALLPICGYPILEIIIRQLRYFGFTGITLSVYHFAEIIMEYFGTGEKWDVKLNYSLEKSPLGTAGPLMLLNDLPDNFLVTNCDILTDLNFELFFENHLKNNNIFTIAGYKKKYKIEYGILEVNPSNRLVRIEEKPETLLTNAGVYIANKRILDFIPENVNFGIDRLINNMLLQHLNVSVYPFHGCWQDIGSIEEYKKAVQEFEIEKMTSLQMCNQLQS